MTDEQFDKLLSEMQAQTKAMQAQAAAIDKLTATLSGSGDTTSDICTEIKALRKAETLKIALDLCKTRTTGNAPLQEQGGLVGSIKDISEFIDKGNTPESWKEYTANETYIKTFSGKPLKIDEI